MMYRFIFENLIHVYHNCVKDNRCGGTGGAGDAIAPPIFASLAQVNPE